MLKVTEEEIYCRVQWRCAIYAWLYIRMMKGKIKLCIISIQMVI